MDRLTGNPARLAFAGAALAAALPVVALAVAAASAPVHGAAWAAAAGSIVLAGGGLLYASRLGAFGGRRP